jgi:CheY-like chemotaxis protein
VSFEVLVVDDNKQAATEFARLITVKAKLSAVATDDPDEAIELLRNNPIKVALLDQRMPKKDGTALYGDLKKIDPLLKAVMLTGEANGQEVGEALNLGFCDYIHKSDVDSITPRVLLHYCSYYTDIAEQSDLQDETIFTFHRGPFWDRYIISFSLISVSSLDEQYSPSSSWKTIVKIDAGERAKRTVTRQKVQRLVIEAEEKAKLSAGVNAKIPVVDGLTAKIESSLEARFKETSLEEESTADSIEREFKLPNEPEDPGVLHVKSRQYEQAPVYKQIRLVIGKTCGCCNSSDVFVVNVNLVTSKVATRQIDFMSDGTNKITNTGIVL